MFMESSEHFSHVYCFNFQFVGGSNDILLGHQLNEKQLAMTVNDVQMVSGGDN